MNLNQAFGQDTHMPWSALLFLSAFGTGLPAAQSSTVPRVSELYVDTDSSQFPRAMGLGVQWDPSDIWDYTPAQRKLTYDRVDRLAPSFIRCMFGAGSYCSLDANGAPRYDWNGMGMRRLYPILNYCQKHNVHVMLGEWGAPFGWKWDDPRWSTVIGQCLDHLINDRGYTCIRYYNKINEPQGGRNVFRTWLSAQTSLKAEIRRLGLDQKVMLVGPDASGREAFQDWIQYMQSDSPSLVGAYEAHWYASSDTEIPNGEVESGLSKARATITATPPLGPGMAFFMGEAGTAEWLNGDSNRHIRDFSYGVFMADYAVQAFRAGLTGVSAWMLDDSMHQQMDSIPSGGKPSGDPKVDFNFKVWGFWNGEGAAMGKPDDEKLRPWFYTWSLLSHCFPRGARVVRVSGSHVPGVRATASIVNDRDVSFVVVNDSQNPQRVRLRLPNAKSAATLAEYHYFENDRPTDAMGYPVVKQMLPGVDLRSGLDVDLPSQGVVVLTSLEGGVAPTMGAGAHLPVTYVRLLSPSGSQEVEVGETLTLQAVTEPGSSPTTFAMSDPSLATIDKHGVLIALREGVAKVTAKTEAGPSATLDIKIRPAGLVIDPLEDWSRTSAHEGSLLFESIHANLFEGDTSRLKRGTDEPSSVTWHVASIRDFSARLYFYGSVENKVRAYVSPDGVTWSPAPMQHEPPAPTQEGWYRAVFTAASVPPGTNYLKIEMANDPVIWSPQLGEVRVHHA